MKRKVTQTIGKNPVRNIQINVPKFTKDIKNSINVLQKSLLEKEHQITMLREAVSNGRYEQIVKKAEDILLLDHNIISNHQTALAKLEAHLSDVLLAIETFQRINSATGELLPEQNLLFTIDTEKIGLEYTQVDLSELTYAHYLFRLFRYEEYVANAETKNVEDKAYGVDEFFTNRMTVIRKDSINKGDID